MNGEGDGMNIPQGGQLPLANSVPGQFQQQWYHGGEAPGALIDQYSSMYNPGLQQHQVDPLPIRHRSDPNLELLNLQPFIQTFQSDRYDTEDLPSFIKRRLRDTTNVIHRRSTIVKSLALIGHTWEKVEVTKSVDRHWKEKQLEEMNTRDWRILMEDCGIRCEGNVVPWPMRRWSELNLMDELLSSIHELGHHDPTPIQRQLVPLGLQNRDVLVVSNSCEGKICAYLVPVLTYILGSPREPGVTGPCALFLTSTRVMAKQIYEETRTFSDRLKVTSLVITGGVSRCKEEEEKRIREGVDIVIATPIRLLEMLRNRYLSLTQCRYVILENADRILDEGFESELNMVLEYLPESKRKPDSDDAENPEVLMRNFDGSEKSIMIVLFSSSLSSSIDALSRQWLRRPAIIYVGVEQPIDKVQQVVYMISEDRKSKKLVEVLNQSFEAPIIIFVNHKERADLLTNLLYRNKYSHVVVHEAKRLFSRENSLAKISEGKAAVMVATDTVLRGISIKDVSLVINYDMAKSIEDYVHRVRRTICAGKHGKAVTFLTPEDKAVFFDLKACLVESPVSTCPPELANHEDAQKAGVFMP